MLWMCEFRGGGLAWWLSDGKSPVLWNLALLGLWCEVCSTSKQQWKKPAALVVCAQSTMTCRQTPIQKLLLTNYKYLSSQAKPMLWLLLIQNSAPKVYFDSILLAELLTPAKITWDRHRRKTKPHSNSLLQCNAIGLASQKILKICLVKVGDSKSSTQKNGIRIQYKIKCFVLKTQQWRR